MATLDNASFLTQADPSLRLQDTTLSAGLSAGATTEAVGEHGDSDAGVADVIGRAGVSCKTR
jgi:hypothetical protein